MASTVEDLLRLAWQVAGEGKPGTRDALLTLAVAESGIDDAVLAERCRKLLVGHRPDHWFASAVLLSQALDRAPVSEVLAKLRAMFPPVRVRHLLMLGDSRRGPYTGQSVPLTRIIEDLAPLPRPIPTRNRASARASTSAHALPFPGAVPASAKAADTSRSDEAVPDAALVALYGSVLLAMAMLLKVVIESTAHDTKAA
jgi:hypothetical protein